MSKEQEEKASATKELTADYVKAYVEDKPDGFWILGVYDYPCFMSKIFIPYALVPEIDHIISEDGHTKVYLKDGRVLAANSDVKTEDTDD